jgi:hypothetical protein
MDFVIAGGFSLITTVVLLTVLWERVWGTQLHEAEELLKQ